MEPPTHSPPLQVWVGVKKGGEAIVHSAACILDDPVIPPDDCCFLLLDFSHTFNSINRASMFDDIRARIPSLAGWMESFYGSQP